VIFPPRLAGLDLIAAQALADPDPWDGFAGFAEACSGCWQPTAASRMRSPSGSR
jgi:hypothetical protein